jgi:putative ABC transport system ATP-binding protein
VSTLPTHARADSGAQRRSTEPPAGDEPVLSVEALSYGVGGVRILDAVSFALSRGELVAVMGPSGSGKTTLLKCITRLLPSGGRVALDGADAPSMSPVELRRRIGMVWQTPFMFEGTVRENLRRAARFSRSGVAEDTFSGLLSRVAFDADVEADARSLSVGQQQRLCVARALACRPVVLLCDEPTAALDHDNALRLEATFRELCGSGLTVLWVTHDARQAERLAQRTLLLARGRLREPEVS